MYAPPPWLIAVGATLTGLAVAGALYAWPWSRQRRRIVVARSPLGPAAILVDRFV